MYKNKLYKKATY